MKGFICLAKEFRLCPEGYKKKPLETFAVLIYDFGSNIREWTSREQKDGW